MEAMIPELLQLGVPSSVALFFYLITNHSAKNRKEERDAQIDGLDKRLTMIESRQVDLEKNISEQIKELHKQLYSIGISTSRIEGFLEGKNDKG